MNKDLVNLFLEVVKIDSVTGEEADLANYLVNLLKDVVSQVKLDSYGNVYAFLEGQGEPLFFSAHLDTVEPGRNIQTVIKNGFIQSDGSTILGGDNKIALACIIEALKRIRSEKLPTRPIELIFTRSEESGNYGAINFDYSLLRSKVGYCFDLSAPVGTITTSSPIYERFSLKIIGKTAHASIPEKAINVLLVLNKLLFQIKLGRLDKESLLNIGVIQGGDVRNTIPGEILLEGELRSLTEDKINLHKKQFIKVLKKVTSSFGAKYELEFVRENGGYKFKSSHLQIKSMVKILESMKLKPVLEQFWGVSDGNIFIDQGLSCLNLGDGGEFAHTKRERIKISEMEKLTQLILALATNKTD